MKTKILSLLLATALCCAHAEQIVLDDAVTYELDNTTMTASLVKSTYLYGLMTGYYRDTETVRDTIYYEEKKYPVISIGENAFSSQIRLKGVMIPFGVKVIGKSAFAGCSDLKEINFPESLDSIGNTALTGCAMENINLPSGIKLGEYVFSSCYSLKTVSINSDIPEGTFQRCTTLPSITIGNNCTRIGKDAFWHCYKLTDVTIPSSVESIGAQAFYKTGLSTISIPAKIKTIDESTFGECSSLQSVQLGTGVTRIEKTAFWKCSSLAEITIPEQVEYVGLNAFLGCSSLSSVTWDAKNCAIFDVTSQRPFSQIESNITSFVFGSKVQSIPDNLCNGMKNLEQVTAYMKNPPQISASVFSNCGNLKDIVCYVPAESLNAYKTADVWKEFNITVIGQEPVISTYYTVTFQDWNGAILKTEQVEEGQSATAPTNPTRDGYTFIGWDKDFSNVTSDLIVTAQYQKNETPSEAITVRLQASSTTGWSKVNLYYWADGISSPAWPGITLSQDANGWYSYTFDASVKSVNIIWNDGNNQTVDITNITTSTCYSLKSTTGNKIAVNIEECEKEVIFYTVTFKDWNGAILKTAQVEEGQSATAPTNPTRDGYTFIGWDKDFSNVTSDLIVTAQYQKNETPSEAITVRLRASSTTGWSKVNLYYWADGISSPAWPGITLSQDANGWYSYTFDASVKSVNIIWNDGSNQTVDITNVPTSTCYSLTSTTGTMIAIQIEDCEESEAIEDVHIESILSTKLLRNGQILILRGDHTYTLTGQEVK